LSRAGFPGNGRTIAHRTLPSSDPPRPTGSTRTSNAASATQWLQQLVRTGLLSAEAVQSFTQFHADRLGEFGSHERLGRALVTAGLLTNYQLQRVLSGQTHGMVLGNYRILEKLGGGSAGTVYLAEHAHLKRRVAIKVMETGADFPESVLDRFFSEMRVLAQL